MSDLTTRRGLAKGLGLAAIAGVAVAAHSGEAQAQARNGRLSSSAIDSAVRGAHRQFAGLAEGANADYIPALAQVPSRFFGVTLVTPHGGVHSTVTRLPFTEVVTSPVGVSRSGPAIAMIRADATPSPAALIARTRTA